MKNTFFLRLSLVILFCQASIYLIAQQFPYKLHPDSIASAGIVEASEYIFKADILEAKQFFVKGDKFAYVSYLLNVKFVFRGSNLKPGYMTLVMKTNYEAGVGYPLDGPNIGVLGSAVVFFCNSYNGVTLDNAESVTALEVPKIQPSEERVDKLYDNNGILLTLAGIHPQSVIREVKANSCRGYIGLNDLYFKSYEEMINYLAKFGCRKK